jgi:hypothetical protein
VRLCNALNFGGTWINDGELGETLRVLISYEMKGFNILSSHGPRCSTKVVILEVETKRMNNEQRIAVPRSEIRGTKIRERTKP